MTKDSNQPMWSQVQKLLHTPAPEAANDRLPPSSALSLRAKLDALAVGQAIRFHENCPLLPLKNSVGYVLALRQYRFGTDVIRNFQLQIGRAKHYFLTVAEDAQGQYLGLSRALSEAEQDVWFGRDALGFFTEPSSAKSIRCKVDMAVDGDWAAERYSKTVDWIVGSVTQAGGSRTPRSFHYNLLVNESGEKALEIEHDDASGENRVFVTVYRPVEDIATIEEVLDAEDTLQPHLQAQVKLPLGAARAEPALTTEEPPLFKDPERIPAQPKQRPDFRRKDEDSSEEIRIPRTVATSDFAEEEEAHLPSFLVARDGNYLSLDEVIPPEPERVRVGLKAARTLIDRAMSRNVRVRDVLRDMLGLDSALSEEVIFELPLSDEDYRQLAMRFRLRPDHRAEIRTHLEEELKRQLGK